MVLLDGEKAFDTVWHKALIHKLALYNLPLYMIKFIISYLYNRLFLVLVGNNSSTERPISAGVPQGSILGPLLYLLFVNDIPKASNIPLTLFADDTGILTSSHKKSIVLRDLQIHLKIVENYHKLSLNTIIYGRSK